MWVALVSSCWVVTEVQKRGKFPAFHLVTELEAYGKVGFTLGCGVLQLFSSHLLQKTALWQGCACACSGQSRLGKVVQNIWN